MTYLTTLFAGGGLASYDTGWINRSDWQDVHMGSDTDKDVDSSVTHNLNAPLSELLVKVLISTDGTDANSYEMADSSMGTSADYGIAIYQVDENNIKVQTGNHGFAQVTDTGNMGVVNTEDWYYKVKVYRLV